MRTVCVQFQPPGSRGLSPEKVCELMLRIALDADVTTFSVERSRARNGYLNFLFSSPTASPTWRAIQRLALQHRVLGARLRGSTIVTCQGTRGWDNYRLLHHFDPGQKLDPLRGRS